MCEVGRFGRGVPRGWDFTRDNPECDEERGRTVLRRGTERVVDVLGESETAVEAGGGGGERKDGGRAGGKGPRGVEVGQLLVEGWTCVCVVGREARTRKGAGVVERERADRGGPVVVVAAAAAAAAGCRPRKTPELIFRVSETSFLHAGVRFELSIDVNGSRVN